MDYWTDYWNLFRQEKYIYFFVNDRLSRTLLQGDKYIFGQNNSRNEKGLNHYIGNKLLYDFSTNNKTFN